MTTVHEHLAEAFRDQARWRRQKAEEYPDDRRNGWAAASLEALARYVLTLPADDPRVERLGVILQVEALDIAHFGPFAGNAVSRFGFDFIATSAAEADAFLDRLVDYATQDAQEGMVLSGVYDEWADGLAEGEREGPF